MLFRSLPLPSINEFILGELFIPRSCPLPPSIDVIAMPLLGRCGAKPGRSRTPAKGVAVEGPRGAEARWAEAAGGRICGDEGGGMLRVGKDGGRCAGGSSGPNKDVSIASSVVIVGRTYRQHIEGDFPPRQASVAVMHRKRTSDLSRQSARAAEGVVGWRTMMAHGARADVVEGCCRDHCCYYFLELYKRVSRAMMHRA